MTKNKFSENSNERAGGGVRLDFILITMNRIKTLLQKSEKTTTITFIYNSLEVLIQSQFVFVACGNHFLDYMSEVPKKLKVVLLATLLCLIRRGELDLELMGFHPEYEVFLEEAKAESNFEMRTRNLNTKYMKKIYKEKLKVAHEYQKFLHRTLQIDLSLN